MNKVSGAERIRRICHKILSDDGLNPNRDITYCNFAVYKILHHFNLHNNFWNEKEKRIMLANEMVDVLESKYIKMPIKEVWDNPNLLLVAGWKNPIGHGHICVIYPSKEHIFSNKWQMEVPLVCNVGFENRIMGLNYAFAERPNIYLISEIEAIDDIYRVNSGS